MRKNCGHAEIEGKINIIQIVENRKFNIPKAANDAIHEASSLVILIVVSFD